MLDRLKREPIVIIAVLVAAASAVLAELGAAGIDVPGWMAALPGILSAIGRVFVTPTADPRDKQGNPLAPVG